MLEITGLTVLRGGARVLHDWSLTVPTGRVAAITGPSGAGKSTLLQAVCGLVRIAEGTIKVDGCDVTSTPTHRRGIVLMSQSGDLFPSMTVGENVAFGLRMRRVDKVARESRVRELLRLVGLPDFEHRDVSTLSGGQSRRVALARALATSPDVLLLDEPFTGLDKATHDDLARDVSRMLREEGTTCLIVTHDADEAEMVADIVVSVA